MKGDVSMSNKTKIWIKAAAVRAIKTVAQTAVGVIGASALITGADGCWRYWSFRSDYRGRLSCRPFCLRTGWSGQPSDLCSRSSGGGECLNWKQALSGLERSDYRGRLSCRPFCLRTGWSGQPSDLCSRSSGGGECLNWKQALSGLEL